MGPSQMQKMRAIETVSFFFYDKESPSPARPPTHATHAMNVRRHKIKPMIEQILPAFPTPACSGLELAFEPSIIPVSAKMAPIH